MDSSLPDVAREGSISAGTYAKQHSGGKKKIQNSIKKYGTSEHLKSHLFILDDIMYDTSWVKDKNIMQLFMNDRHLKYSLIITMPYSLSMPPALRFNVDYIFILRENYISNRKRLFEHYAGMFPTFEIFCQVMDACTNNYECLVIDNTTKSNKIEDMIYWYKADEHGEFTLGAPEFWKHHNQHYSNQARNREEDINAMRRKKNAPIISVHKFQNGK